MFETIVEQVLQNEGSYSNEIDGRYIRDGSVTRHGVNYFWNKRVLASLFGIEAIEDMWKLERPMAADLFHIVHWEPFGLKDCAITLNLGYQILDMSVNKGPRDAGKNLQSALNTCKNVSLVVDGAVGPYTRTALNRVIALDPGLEILNREYKLRRIHSYLGEFNQRTLKARNVKTMRRHRDEIVSWTNRVYVELLEQV